MNVLSLGGKKTKKSDGCEVFMRIMLYTGILVVVLNVVNLLQEPHIPHYFTSVIPRADANGIPIPLHVLIIVTHAFIWLGHWFPVNFYVFIFMAHSVTTLKTMDSLG